MSVTHPAGGHYVLLLRLAEGATLRIGARPAVAFPAGWYVYAGSAQGAGGLAARLARHHRRAKRHYWQIDWLLTAAELVAAWTRPGASGPECPWATALEGLGGQRRPRRFGSGDCRCAGHLVWFTTRPDLARLTDPTGESAFARWEH